MKRVLAILLMVLLFCSGCGKENEMVAEGVYLESCCFTDAVRAYDHEYSRYSSPQSKEGYVYVDLTFAVFRTNGEDFDENNISGRLTYQGTEIDLIYRQDKNNGIVIIADPVKSGEFGRVHLFAKLPEEAMGEKLIVSYTVDGKTHTAAVAPKNEKEPLAMKTELKVGDKVRTPGNLYQIEVLECFDTDTIKASGKGAEKYTLNHTCTCVRLKITNNSTQTLGVWDGIFAYAGETGLFITVSSYKEIENNTDLNMLDFYEGVDPGKTETILLVIAKDSVRDGLIRINLGGTAYYIRTN